MTVHKHALFYSGFEVAQGRNKKWRRRCISARRPFLPRAQMTLRDENSRYGVERMLLNLSFAQEIELSDRQGGQKRRFYSTPNF